MAAILHPADRDRPAFFPQVAADYQQRRTALEREAAGVSNSAVSGAPSSGLSVPR